MKLIDMLFENKQFNSKNEARRAIKGNSVSINGVKVQDENAELYLTDLHSYKELFDGTDLNIDWSINQLEVWLLKENDGKCLLFIREDDHFLFVISNGLIEWDWRTNG